MRGKARKILVFLKDTRITPAYAGKRIGWGGMKS